MTKIQMPEYCDQETKEGDYSMQQPFWKLNLGLLLVVCALLIAIFFYQVQLKRPVSIEPEKIFDSTLTQKTVTFDQAKIYQNDLFDTYKSAPTQQEKATETQPVPLPPQPVVVPPPPIEPPTFLPPLSITLTGIFMLNDEAKNRAIIIDNQTKKETTYKIGDEIESAQIIAIFPNKVLLVRSNGQREILYLRQDTATADIIKTNQKDWSRVVKKLTAQHYLVDRQEFIDEVGTISNLVDLFNLATAYKQGKSIGIKIGKFEGLSLAHTLDFVPGDIIIAINKLPVTTTEERLVVYKDIAQQPEESDITIEYLRNEKSQMLTIKLGSILQPRISTTKLEPKKSDIQQEEKEEHERQISILKQREKFAPTLRDLRVREKENIIRHQRAVESRKRGNKD